MKRIAFRNARLVDPASGLDVKGGLLVENGRIADVRIGDGDVRRTARIREVLTGLQCSQRPPAGMPVTRVELRGG